MWAMGKPGRCRRNRESDTYRVTMLDEGSCRVGLPQDCLSKGKQKIAIYQAVVVEGIKSFESQIFLDLLVLMYVDTAVA